MTDQGENEKKQRRSNATIAVACLSFFVCMIGAAYASVPLYRIFCQVTGYGGTTQRVEQYSDTISRQDDQSAFRCQHRKWPTMGFQAHAARGDGAYRRNHDDKI
ncbi:cytochrome c oxidase assembly protein ctaG [Brucella melitensis]|nr:cytochrome c oxidase assembly protein ctaG [Brucella melitensis]